MIAWPKKSPVSAANFLRPLRVLRATLSFNLCRRRFVLNFSREQTGKAA
jgi:hypothetical protein